MQNNIYLQSSNLDSDIDVEINFEASELELVEIQLDNDMLMNINRC